MILHRISHALVRSIICAQTLICGAAEPLAPSSAPITSSTIARDTQLQRQPTGSAAASSLSPSDATPRSDTNATPQQLQAELEFGEQIVLHQHAHWEPWALSISADYFYSDNVALASAGELPDWYLRSGGSLSYTNRISGNWFIRGGLEAYAYQYQRYDLLDFLLIRPDLSVLRRIEALGDAFIGLGYSGYWISQGDFSTEAFRNHGIATHLQKTWRPSRGQQLIAGLSADYSLQAQPSAPQRHEYAAYLAYRLQLTEHLAATASYRSGYFDYPSLERQDWNHVISLGLSYELTPWARLSLAASAARNVSNYAFFDYDNLVSGIGLSLHLEF